MIESSNKNNRYASIASEIAQFVHEHIGDEITTDILAGRVAVSKYHLNRMFHSLTGFHLGQYIQTQRMSVAFDLLSEGQQNVVDVGLAVGYESHSSFTRAFMKAFGCKPNDVKRGTAPNFQQPKAANMNAGLIAEPEICELPSRHLVGLYGQGFREQNFIEIAMKLYGELNENLADARIQNFADQKLVGVSIDSPWRGEQELCRFFAGVDLDVSETTKHLTSFNWKEGVWARFVHLGPYRFMWQTISQVYSSWVIPNGIELRDTAIVQVYVNNPQTTLEQDLQTHLYFRIRL